MDAQQKIKRESIDAQKWEVACSSYPNTLPWPGRSTRPWQARPFTFRAGLHPRHPISDLGEAQQRTLYDAMRTTVDAAIAGGGRYDEWDLHNRPGGYHRLLDNSAVGRPCPNCNTAIEKIQYLGGACYLCPRCQT
jgi:formamidopyrimidine-DNA glycosylase